MAFQAGSINAGALLSCHKFVTHTTGLATTFGTELAQGNVINALSFLSIPMFFLLGAMSSGFFVDSRIQKNRIPNYPAVMGASCFLLCAVFLGGIAGQFGIFGGELDLTRHYLLLIMLAFTCGLQNGTVTSACGAVIRITHMTGLTTDLGIGLTRVLTHSHHLNSRQNEVRANLIRLGIFASFSGGALVSTFLFLRHGYWGFLIPSLLGVGLLSWSLFRYHRSQIHLAGKKQSA